MDYQRGDFAVLKNCTDPEYNGALVRIADPLRLRLLANGRRAECYLTDIGVQGLILAVQAHQLDRPLAVEHRLSVVSWSNCLWRPCALHTKVATNMLTLKTAGIKRGGYHD